MNPVEAIDQAKTNKRHVSPCHSNRASQLGGPCERQLVYWRSQWDQADVPSLSLQYLFDEGRRQEAAALEDLHEAGIDLVEAQRSFPKNDQQITGMVDGRIEENGHRPPVEIKGLNPYDWEAINTFQDLLDAKKPWLKTYAGQMLLYLYLTEEEYGYFLLRNKTSGRYKWIRVDMDYGVAESLLQRAERINAHVAAKTLPDRIPYDPAVCDRCPFKATCLPDVQFGPATELVDDATLATKLDRLTELAPLSREHEQLRKEIQLLVLERPDLVVGRWRVTGRWVERTVKPSEGRTSRYWRYEIAETIPQEVEQKSV